MHKKGIVIFIILALEMTGAGMLHAQTAADWQAAKEKAAAVGNAAQQSNPAGTKEEMAEAKSAKKEAVLQQRAAFKKPKGQWRSSQLKVPEKS